MNLVHQKIPYIARLRHLENHTEVVDLYVMNLHLNRLSVGWTSVVSLSVIPWMIDLSGELSHVMKNGSITATLTPQNSNSVPVNLPKSWFKKSHFSPKVMLCVWWNFEDVIHWKIVPNVIAIDVDLYSQLERVYEILRLSYSALVNQKRVLLQQENVRHHTT